MNRFKDAKSLEADDEAPDSVWLKEYDLEIAGFEEFELEVLLNEVSGDNDQDKEKFLQALGHASQYGLCKEAKDRLRANSQWLSFDWNSHWFVLGDTKGRSPMEIAWMLYKLSDDELLKQPLSLSRARIAFRDNVIKIGINHRGPFDENTLEDLDDHAIHT